MTKDWVMACQMEKAWVSEKPFLVGDSNVFTEGKPMPKLTVSFVSPLVLWAACYSTSILESATMSK